MRGLVVAIALAALFVAAAGCIGNESEAPVDPAAAGASNATDVADGPRGLAHQPGGEIVPVNRTQTPVRGLALSVGMEAFEPTVGVLSNGTVFYAAARDPVAAGWQQHVMRSSDGGQTWTDVSPTLPDGETGTPPETNDPYLWVDEETDRVYSAPMAPVLTCMWLSWSDDAGASWSTQPVACQGNGEPYDHQTIAGGPPTTLPTQGYENILYQCTNRIYDSNCARSLDGGRTWSSGTPVFEGYSPDHAEVDPSGPQAALEGALQGFCGGLHGHVTVGPEGTAYLPREFCGDAAVGVTTDDGTTWSTHSVADDAYPGPDPSVAVDDAGNAFYLYPNRTGTLKLSTSTDQGQSWSDPVEVGHPNLTAANHPTIDAEGTGTLALAYPGTENLPNGFANEELDDGYQPGGDEQVDQATWNGYVAVVEDALAEEPTIRTSRVNPTSDPLVRGMCGNDCPGITHFIDVQMDPTTGRPYAAFVDACTEECVDEGTPEDNRGGSEGHRALLGTLAQGPRTLGEGALPPLGANTTATGDATGGG